MDELKKIEVLECIQHHFEIQTFRLYLKNTISILFKGLLKKSTLRDIQLLAKKNYEIKQHNECLKGFFYKGVFYSSSLENYYPKKENRSFMYLDKSLFKEAFNLIKKISDEEIKILFLEQYLLSLLNKINSAQDFRNQVPDIVWESTSLRKKYPDLKRTNEIIIEDKDKYNKMIDIFSYYIFFNLIK